MAQSSSHAAGPSHTEDESPRRTPAEEARTLVASRGSGTLCTLTADGHPWGSLVSYAVTDTGAPVLCVSLLAEHGRNLAADARASLLVVAAASHGGDPLEAGRVTLAGTAVRPDGDAALAARAALLAAHPSAATYVDWDDFALWVLPVDRVRWVGGYARMDSVDGDDYARAQPDPVAPSAAHAVRHMNEDHSDALLLMAQALGGRPEATAASCTAADRYGLDLLASGAGEIAEPVRVAFAEPITEPGGLRAATVALTKRARELMA